MDEYPLLKYVPESWAPWKARARKAGTNKHDVWLKARRMIDARRSRGDKRDCIADKLIEDFNNGKLPYSEDELNRFIGVILEAGAETTSSTLQTLILCLALHPEVQEKARQELDAVCGSDR